jgi:prevent-host-death family protein
MDLVHEAVHFGGVSEVNIHEAKSHLSSLLRRVAAGEEIVITRAGRPIARLVPVDAAPKQKFGIDRGVFSVPDDFDGPLPDDTRGCFES